MKNHLLLLTSSLRTMFPNCTAEHVYISCCYLLAYHTFANLYEYFGDTCTVIFVVVLMSELLRDYLTFVYVPTMYVISLKSLNTTLLFLDCCDKLFSVVDIILMELWFC